MSKPLNKWVVLSLRQTMNPVSLTYDVSQRLPPLLGDAAQRPRHEPRARDGAVPEEEGILWWIHWYMVNYTVIYGLDQKFGHLRFKFWIIFYIWRGTLSWGPKRAKTVQTNKVAYAIPLIQNFLFSELCFLSASIYELPYQLSEFWNFEYIWNRFRTGPVKVPGKNDRSQKWDRPVNRAIPGF